jgi:hypothetical protein
VVVKLIAARSPQLEARLEEVDETFRVPQLLRCHPVEVAVAEGLGGAVGVRSRDVPVEIGVFVGLVAARHRQWDAVDGALLADADLVAIAFCRSIVLGLARDLARCRLDRRRRSKTRS